METQMADDSRIMAANFWSKVSIPSDFQCWEWTGNFHANGYGRVGETGRCHRWSYEFFNGPIPDGLLVLHSCDNKKCVNPRHLRVGTHAENVQDAIARGRYKYCGNRKVTPEQAEYIRRNPDKMKLREIAAKFGIAKSTASMIRSGKTWL
jgi:hypothetical protein